ncbi:T9SS type A sorting domain-containing protein [Kaistella flava (ex Peng et al. 2021)]|uniref:T9SS type A sorting domain-containing protein n=1 Tax=Kaistella flava (ex Peng et al. 2021) TaxID=2038776 RepID=A0A7M2Y7Q6_9FLAO|nr:S8 family peptidase [Kaistella flava (ex Peng et al. 2021)]QOW10298.1 T9SS type A sorting domain-containing protein [Kaistella flava (ex Peng et al. 2021)]
MKKSISFFILLVFVFTSAQTELVFVFFKDKPNKEAFYTNPLSELTQKSLDRRTKFGIALNDQDAPIEPTYIQNVKNLGFTVKDYSKWMNGVAVNATTAQILNLQSQPYVQSVESFIKHPPGGKSEIKKVNKFEEFNNTLGKTNFNYGSGLAQINQVNLRPLHIAGFTGTGVTIAVIDTGFPTVNTGSVYARIRNNGQIKGGYNFVNKSSDIYNSSLNNHGSYCLGVIAGYVDNSFVGTAPDADFYLYASEDADNEIPEEQLYWAEAAEEADRKGVDLITTSLGYYDFDDTRYNLLYSDMNGTTSFIARVAQIATEKGIFVLAAAGNEAQKPWHYIITPADNAKVFTVGAVTSTGASSTFSSFGPNSVGVIKPDGSARGTSTYMGYNNSVTSSNGTSFATPLAAGGVACLIQAMPTKPIADVSNLLRQNASLYPNTDPQKGYGILNFGKAWNTTLSTINVGNKSMLQIYPNPVAKTFTIKTDEKIISVELYDTLGRKVQTLKNEKTNNIERLANGVYFVKVQTDKNQYIEKLIKE